MKSTFEFKTQNGKSARFEAEYSRVLVDRVIDADGDKVVVGKELSTAGRTMLSAYLDDVLVDSCWNSSFWHLIDLYNHPGVKKIWGIDIALVDPDVQQKYTEWLEALIDAGTSDEAKAFIAEEDAKRRAEEIDYWKSVIRKAKRQHKLPTEKEAKRMKEQWNLVVNEGGEGYVPDIITKEEYECAIKSLAEYGVEL